MVPAEAYQDEEVIRVVMKLLEDTVQREREYEVLLRWQKLEKLYSKMKEKS